ncbi:MAG TPA: hypothetical protein VFJ47_03170 [Terriglobales bacterium]|nr:hypothetical protein [Terriglobales bacterium]
MRFFIASLLALAVMAGSGRFPTRAESAQATNASAVESMQQKLTYLEQNGALARPNQAPTKITEQEVNAYLSSGRIKLPSGVQSLQLHGDPGVVTGTSRVDFDQVKAGQRNSSPLLSVFSGVHDVVVVAHAHGVGHQGLVHVDSVSLDGIEIPHFALELFVEKYIQPRYPGIGIDSQFNLPDKIDTAVIGQREVTVTQR